ncbi:MAG TPA: hypothetical protein VLB73_05190 [Patescibacteria group bacterium]|nr:hypothetical protein [Patescibacteria group bacterium]
MRKFFSFLFLFIAVLLFAKLSFAQSATSSAAPVHLSFPIAELGNCSSANSCKIYCDDPTHVDACVAYAKAHGFYKQSDLDTNQQNVLADAKTTLGCDSLASCRVYCQDSSHAEACSTFAQKHNLTGGTQTPTNTTLEKAKEVLGCDSIDSCKALCSDSANKDKCSAFAKENGIHGGNQTVGPGGCTSDSSCKTFCSNPDNFQTCQQFVQARVASASGQSTFTGPGGCTSEQSCRSFCDQNPTACHMPSRPQIQTTNTQNVSQSGKIVSPQISQEEYCRMYPSYCEGIAPPPSGLPTIYPTPNYASYCQSKGCTFTGTTCACPTPTQSANSGEANTGLGVTPTLTIFPTNSVHSVQGAATEKNILQWFFDQLFHMK